MLGVTAEADEDELWKELWCDLMDCATAAAAAAAEELCEDVLLCDELLFDLLLADEE